MDTKLDTRGEKKASKASWKTAEHERSHRFHRSDTE